MPELIDGVCFLRSLEFIMQMTRFATLAPAAVKSRGSRSNQQPAKMVLWDRRILKHAVLPKAASVARRGHSLRQLLVPFAATTWVTPLLHILPLVAHPFARCFLEVYHAVDNCYAASGLKLKLIAVSINASLKFA